MTLDASKADCRNQSALFVCTQKAIVFPAPSECLVSRSALRFHSQRAVIVHAARCDCLCSVVKTFWQQADFVFADFYFYVLSLIKSPFAGC